VGRHEERTAGRDFAGFVEWVVIPIAASVVASLTADGIKEVIKRLLAAKSKAPVAVEKHPPANGQEVVVVRKK
jgi:hypothetical protein